MSPQDLAILDTILDEIELRSMEISEDERVSGMMSWGTLEDESDDMMDAVEWIPDADE